MRRHGTAANSRPQLDPSPSHPEPQVIRLAFALPAAGDIASLDAFLSLACLVTDLVGSYRLSPGGFGGMG